MDTKKVLFLNIVLFLLISVPQEINANGTPVMSYSSINRVGNPELLSVSEIKILHEVLNITHIDGYNCFDIVYYLENISNRPMKDLNYGFPIDYLTSFGTEAYHISEHGIVDGMQETGWKESLIKDVKFEFEDNELPYLMAHETVNEASIGDDAGEVFQNYGIDRRWFYTQFTVPAKSTAKLRVCYKVYANVGINEGGLNHNFPRYSRLLSNGALTDFPVSSRFFASYFRIFYDFTPAQNFGNNSLFQLDVNIDLSNLGNVSTLLSKYTVFTRHLSMLLYGEASNFEPIDLVFNYQPINSEEKLYEKISSNLISKDKYKIKIESNTVTIDFNKPIFASDLICDFDYSKVDSISSEILYANQNKDIFLFLRDDSNHNKLQGPVFIPLVDLFFDGIIRKDNQLPMDISADFDSDRFKIKRIILKSKSFDDANVKDIKLLDAR